MTTSNTELVNMCKKLDIPLIGIFSKDNLPDYPKIGNYIVNLDDVSGGGTHWTCFMIKPNLNLYFDSFGAPAPLEVIKLLNQHKKGYYNNNWVIQDLKSELCGYYCIALLHHLKNSKNLLSDYNDFVNQFEDDTSKNGMILKKYFIKHNLLTNTRFLRKLLISS